MVAGSRGVREEAESTRTGRIFKDPCLLTYFSQLAPPLKFPNSSKEYHSLENLRSGPEPLGDSDNSNHNRHDTPFC